MKAIRRAWPCILVLAILGLYLATVAPTILWGDDAYFQRTAWTGELQADGSGHWLWLQFARLFVRLAWGDIAFRVNLLSAVSGTGTIVLLYGAARALELSLGGATAAVLSLAVAHTFWTHSVRAEVYTVFTLLLATQLWLWSSWQRRRPWPLLAAVSLFGITLLGHQMALLLLPAFVVLLWRRRTWLENHQWWWLLFWLILGLIPFFLVVYAQIAAPTDRSLLASLSLYFTHAGTDFRGAFFDFSLRSLHQDTLIWVGLLGLQFVGLAFPLGLWGIVSKWRSQWPSPWLSFLGLYLTNLLFAFSYRVNDRFVFFLPGYVVFSLFIGAGWDSLMRRSILRRHGWLPMALSLLLFVTPIVTYDAVPRMLTAAGLNPLNIRQLPGREPNRFFLWPPKQGHLGAATYGRSALENLPPNSTLIADHTPLEPLRYLQSVEGLRPDVNLVKIEPGEDLAPTIRAQPGGTDIFLADKNPDYYNLSLLPDVRLEQVGPIFRVLLPPSP